MNKEFLALFLEKTDFPRESRPVLLEAAEAVNAKAAETFGQLAARYPEYAAKEMADRSLGYGYAVKENQELAETVAAQAGVSPFTVWLFVLVEASIPVREDWAKKGRPEQLFWDTFSDLRYKVIECKNVKGVWGNFVASWYAIFYTDRIVKLGRLEYETVSFGWEPYEARGVRVEQGDPVLSVHIPSSGEPFDEEARLDSYRKAYEFFPELRKEGKLILVCHSWLLYPEYAKLLKPGSNFLSFQKDFDIVEAEESEKFSDDWRLFGADAEKPMEQWPERTSMQRSFKEYFLSGGKPGLGKGILLFDGEKIANR